MWAQKLQNPTMLRCASNFFKVLLKFKMAAIDKLYIFLVAQKLKNLSLIIHIVHYPTSGNVHVILLKFKMATTNRLFKYIFVTEKSIT